MNGYVELLRRVHCRVVVSQLKSSWSRSNAPVWWFKTVHLMRNIMFNTNRHGDNRSVTSLGSLWLTHGVHFHTWASEQVTRTFLYMFSWLLPLFFYYCFLSSSPTKELPPRRKNHTDMMSFGCVINIVTRCINNITHHESIWIQQRAWQPCKRNICSREVERAIQLMLPKRRKMKKFVKHRLELYWF